MVAPEFWLYFLGGLFIVVTLFLPDGIAGLVRKLRRRKPVDSSKSSKEEGRA